MHKLVKLTQTLLCARCKCVNIPSGPIYISKLVRIGRTCSTYEDFVKRNMFVIKQGFLYVELVRSFKKFYMKYVNLMSKCNVRTKRHVSEGICGLYDGLPSVYKFVTTRRPRLWTLMYQFTSPLIGRVDAQWRNHMSEGIQSICVVIFCQVLFIRHSCHFVPKLSHEVCCRLYCCGQFHREKGVGEFTGG